MIDISTIPKIEEVKLFLISGTFPKKYPATMPIATQKIPPITL